MNMNRIVYFILALILLFELGCSNTPALQISSDRESPLATSIPSMTNESPVLVESATASAQTEHDDYDYVLEFPSDKYPETALHILGAIEQGYSDVCTIDRDGAEENRKESLAGIETRDGYDRDEWPMAMCDEGGKGASVAYVESSDNRGAGSWVGHQLSAYEDGEKVLFIVSKPKNLFPVQSAESSEELPASEDQVNENISYPNCTAVRDAGKAPLHRGDPGYAKKLDRDGDGIACE